MEIREFGDRDKRTLLLLHGFQCPWQLWETYIQHYRDAFHILVPVMPGHTAAPGEPFVSFSQTAQQLEDFCASRCGRHLYAVYGLSMGGVLAAQLLQNGRLRFDKVILDGTPLVPMGPLLRELLLHFYLDTTHKAQRRDKKVLARAVKSICPREYLSDFLAVLDPMSDATIRNYINSAAAFRLDERLDLQGAELFFYHGTAASEWLAQKTARFLAQQYPESTITCFRGKGHCENALMHPECMIRELDPILWGREKGGSPPSPGTQT